VRLRNQTSGTQTRTTRRNYGTTWDLRSSAKLRRATYPKIEGLNLKEVETISLSRASLYHVMQP